MSEAVGGIAKAVGGGKGGGGGGGGIAAKVMEMVSKIAEGITGAKGA